MSRTLRGPCQEMSRWHRSDDSPARLPGSGAPTRDGFHTACPSGGWYGTPETGGLQAQFARIRWPTEAWSRFQTSTQIGRTKSCSRRS